MKCYLMNENQKVAFIELRQSDNRIVKIYELLNIDYAPLSVINAYHDKSKNITKEMNNWYRHRGIPSWRKGLSQLLENLNVHSTTELLNKAYGLSLSDRYWIKEEKSPLKWEDINFFENDYHGFRYLKVSLSTSQQLSPNLYSPNNTTDGMLPKGWIIEDGNRILVKGTYTPSQQEPINEWLSSEICNRLGFDYCSYQVDIFDDKIVSKCNNFLKEHEEVISAYDIFYSQRKSNQDNDFMHYQKILCCHGISNAKEALENMLILDYLIMNTDRHMKNFGIIRNTKTLEWVRCTPIFDSGQAMNCNQLMMNMKFYDGFGKLFTNTNKKFSTYLELVSDLKRIDIKKLDGLSEEYNKILHQYQMYTEMPEQRIKKLVEGLETRISLLEREIEKFTRKQQPLLDDVIKNCQSRKKEKTNSISECKKDDLER